MADLKEMVVNALRNVPLNEAIPFGAATTPEGSPTALSNMLGEVASIPKNLVDASKVSTAQKYGPPPATLTDSDIPVNDPLIGASAGAAMALAGMGAPAAVKGAAGMFGGRLAQTADLRALKEAQAMREGGKNFGAIRNDTGWFQSPMDSKWRFEIPDEKMALKYMPTNVGEKAIGSVDSLISHPELKKAYPQLFDYRLELSRDVKHPTGEGWFSKPDNSIRDFAKPSLEVMAPNASHGRSVASHELQHGIQDVEGFAFGASPSMYAKAMEDDLRRHGMKGYNFNKVEDKAHDFYNRTAGEVEARNVQKRLDYSPAGRKLIHPWESQDVPFQNQLLIEALKNFK